MQNFLASEGGTSPLRLPLCAQARNRAYLSNVIASHPPQCQKRIYATGCTYLMVELSILVGQKIKGANSILANSKTAVVLATTKHC